MKSNSWRSVYQAVLEQIADGRLQPGQKLPPEAQMAHLLGVSKVTAHRALRELADDGYLRRVPRAGTFVAGTPMARPRRIAMILPSTDGFLEIKHLAGVRQTLAPQDELVLHVTENDAVREYQALLEIRRNLPDAIIALSCCHPQTTAALQEIDKAGCPVVCIDRVPVGSGLEAVTSANREYARMALKRLAVRGHTRIAYFGFHAPHVSSLVDRQRAYREHMAEAGEDPDAFTRLIEPKTGREAGIEHRLFEDSLHCLTRCERPITAAFCANEHYLEVLLDTLSAVPDMAPRRFEIAAFCDWPRLGWQGARLLVVRQNAAEVGRLAAKMALERLDGRPRLEAPVEVPATIEEVVEPWPGLTIFPDSTNGGNP